MYQTLKFTLSGVISLLTFVSIAQIPDKALHVESVVNTNKSVDFNYTKKDPGTYTVIVTFSSLSNSNASERQVAIASGFSGKLFSITPANPNSSIGYSYKCTWIRGKVIRKYNQEFQYLLPYKAGTKVKVMEAGYVPARFFGNEIPPDWKAYNFYTEKEDTVVASRKGLVVDVKDSYDTSIPGAEFYKSEMNTVVIEHEDGSFSNYKGFKKGVLVEVGQKVIPGTPLGINTLFNSKSTQYNISFHVYYLRSDDVESQKDQSLKTYKSLYSSICPHFYTQENVNAVLQGKTSHTAATNDDLIKQELSKKEIKNLLHK